MINNTTKIIIAIAVLEIALLLAAGFYIQNQTTNFNSNLASNYSARKEDLLIQQQKLELMISSLNSTLQNEAAKSKALSTQISAATGTQTPQTTVSQPATPPVQPTPVTVPVSRAS